MKPISLLLFTCSLAACSAASAVWNYDLTPEPPESDFERVESPRSVQPSFSWPIQAKEDETGIAIGILKARYQVAYRLERNSNCQQLCAPFEASARVIMNQFRSALRDDLSRMLQADGFEVPEEFSSLDEMTFPEKDRTKMVLVPVITLTVTTRPEEPDPVYWQTASDGTASPLKPFKIYPKRYYGGDGVNGYKQTGSIAVRVDGELQLLEPLTQERLLVTDTHVRERSRNFAFYYWTEAFEDENGEITKTVDHLVEGYDDRETVLVTVLNDVYAATYEQLRVHLGRDELLLLKPDAERLKERWQAVR